MTLVPGFWQGCDEKDFTIYYHFHLTKHKDISTFYTTNSSSPQSLIVLNPRFTFFFFINIVKFNQSICSYIMMVKPSSGLLALLATIAPVSAYWKGMNLQAHMGNGACKTQVDWAKDFSTMAALPGHFTSARVYASSDCNTLANAVPAALAAGVTILAGVWTEDNAHFEAEKAALLAAVRAHGVGWLVAVSVGSEDLYRHEITASSLAQKIYDVRGMMSTVPGGKDIQVGHVDTSDAWVKPENKDVIHACDFIGVDSYPYYQNTDANSIDNAYNEFYSRISAVQSVVSAAGSGAWIWVTETGWPTAGPTENQAVASTENAKQYWKVVACSAFQHMHVFWYSLQDFDVNPTFGLVDNNYNAKYDLTC
jgi:glucan endo-1,3-beta-D-glucosidase